jgi:hypothetical protein
MFCSFKCRVTFPEGLAAHLNCWPCQAWDLGLARAIRADGGMGCTAGGEGLRFQTESGHLLDRLKLPVIKSCKKCRDTALSVN